MTAPEACDPTVSETSKKELMVPTVERRHTFGLGMLGRSIEDIIGSHKSQLDRPLCLRVIKCECHFGQWSCKKKWIENENIMITKACM